MLPGVNKIYLGPKQCICKSNSVENSDYIACIDIHVYMFDYFFKEPYLANDCTRMNEVVWKLE